MLDYGFKNSLDRVKTHKDTLQDFRDRKAILGIPFLDEAMRGILPTDLVLIGAASGIGKTELASNIAYKNGALGKKVYGIFLEAYENEIEIRQLYRMMAASAKKKKINPPHFDQFLHGEADWLYDFKPKSVDFGNVYTKYRGKQYTIDDIRKDLLAINQAADLIVIDHLHYFDLVSKEENKEITEIVKAISDIVQVIKRPVVLVSHIRKQGRDVRDLTPELEDFMGTSNIYKIATKVVTLAPAPPGTVDVSPDVSTTFMRIRKYRSSSAVTQYTAALSYEHGLNDYRPKYKLGYVTNLKGEIQFNEIKPEHRPHWFRGGTNDSQGIKKEDLQGDDLGSKKPSDGIKDV